MAEESDTHERADLAQVNEELTHALKLCHSLVDDYRSKLASRLESAADLQAANDDEDTAPAPR